MNPAILRTLLTLAALSAFASEAFASSQILPVCERTQQVQDFIVQKINSDQQTDKTCADITRDDLASLERIAITRRNLEDLIPGDFSGLPRLKILNLRGYRNSSFPEELFVGLSSLETLVLIGTGLEVYPEDFLVDLPNLKNCHCFRNPLVTIEEPVLRRLAAMASLDVLDFDESLRPSVKEKLREIFPAGGSVELNFH